MPADRSGDRLLSAAGILAVAIAVLLVIAPFPRFASGYRLLAYAANTGQLLIDAAAFLAAGTTLLVPRTRRYVGPGLALGAAVVLPADFAVLVFALDQSGSPGAGAALVLVAELLVVIVVILISLLAARKRRVTLNPRLLRAGPSRWATRLVVLLAVAGAVGFAVQVLRQHSAPGLGDHYLDDPVLLVPVGWTTAMALIVPAAGAVARPRSFGVALIAGWICAGLADAVFDTGLATSVFGYTLVALALALIALARTARQDPALR